MAQNAAPLAQRMAAVGSLESLLSLATLTDLVAQRKIKRTSFSLRGRGLDLVPAGPALYPSYRSKNVGHSIDIRNAVVHGTSKPRGQRDQTQAESRALRHPAARVHNAATAGRLSKCCSRTMGGAWTRKKSAARGRR